MEININCGVVKMEGQVAKEKNLFAKKIIIYEEIKENDNTILE